MSNIGTLCVRDEVDSLGSRIEVSPDLLFLRAFRSQARVSKLKPDQSRRVCLPGPLPDVCRARLKRFTDRALFLFARTKSNIDAFNRIILDAAAAAAAAASVLS